MMNNIAVLCPFRHCDDVKHGSVDGAGRTGAGSIGRPGDGTGAPAGANGAAGSSSAAGLSSAGGFGNSGGTGAPAGASGAAASSSAAGLSAGGFGSSGGTGAANGNSGGTINDGNGSSDSESSDSDAEERATKRRRIGGLQELAAGPAQAGAAPATGSCEWQGSYGDLLSKHVAECPHAPVPCPHVCGVTLRRGDLTAHERVCKKLREICDTCGEAVALGSMDAHRKESAERHVVLLERKVKDQARALEAEKLRAGGTEKHVDVVERVVLSVNPAKIIANWDEVGRQRGWVSGHEFCLAGVRSTPMRVALGGRGKRDEKNNKNDVKIVVQVRSKECPLAFVVELKCMDEAGRNLVNRQDKWPTQLYCDPRCPDRRTRGIVYIPYADFKRASEIHIEVKLQKEFPLALRTSLFPAPAGMD